MSAEKPDVFFPWVLGDYFKDTRGLTRSEHGGYLLLLAECWLKGPLPDDDKYLAAVTLSSPYEWKKLREVLSKYFQIKSGNWLSVRCELERAKAVENKEKYAKAGRAGGLKSAKNRQAKGQRSFNPASAPTKLEPQVGSNSGERSFQNEAFRKEAAEAMGESWCVSWLDQCTWIDLPVAAIVCPRKIVATTIGRDLRKFLIVRGVAVRLMEATA